MNILFIGFNRLNRSLKVFQALDEQLTTFVPGNNDTAASRFDKIISKYKLLKSHLDRLE